MKPISVNRNPQHKSHSRGAPGVLAAMACVLAIGVFVPQLSRKYLSPPMAKMACMYKPTPEPLITDMGISRAKQILPALASNCELRVCENSNSQLSNCAIATEENLNAAETKETEANKRRSVAYSVFFVVLGCLAVATAVLSFLRRHMKLKKEKEKVTNPHQIAPTS